MGKLGLDEGQKQGRMCWCQRIDRDRHWHRDMERDGDHDVGGGDWNRDGDGGGDTCVDEPWLPALAALRATPSPIWDSCMPSC